MIRAWIASGAIAAALAVVAGAFGSHALRERLGADAMRVFQTAVQYHFIHALALIAVGLVLWQGRHGLITTSGWLFALGLCVFAAAFTGSPWVGQSGLGPSRPSVAWLSSPVGSPWPLVCWSPGEGALARW